MDFTSDSPARMRDLALVELRSEADELAAERAAAEGDHELAIASRNTDDIADSRGRVAMLRAQEEVAVEGLRNLQARPFYFYDEATIRNLLTTAKGAKATTLEAELDQRDQGTKFAVNRALRLATFRHPAPVGSVTRLAQVGWDQWVVERGARLARGIPGSSPFNARAVR